MLSRRRFNTAFCGLPHLGLLTLTGGNSDIQSGSSPAERAHAIMVAHSSVCSSRSRRLCAVSLAPRVLSPAARRRAPKSPPRPRLAPDMPTSRPRRLHGHKRPRPSKIPRRSRYESSPRNSLSREQSGAVRAGSMRRTTLRKPRIAEVPEGEVLRIVEYSPEAPWVGRPRDGNPRQYL